MPATDLDDRVAALEAAVAALHDAPVSTEPVVTPQDISLLQVRVSKLETEVFPPVAPVVA